MATIDDVYDKVEDCIDKVDDCIDKVDDVLDKIENLELVSYAICTMCHGDGTIIPSYNEGEDPPEPITCPSCSGAGRVSIGSADEKD